MNLITKLAYNALTKTIQAIAPGGVSILVPTLQTEYAWNTDTTTSTNASSANAGHGPSGATVPSGAIAGSAIYKRCFFNTPILDTDKIVIELTDGNGWFELSAQDPGTGVQGYIEQNGFFYGLGIRWGAGLAGTAVDVYFAQYQYANGLYGAAGVNWNGGRKYRVRKSSF